MAVAGIKAPYSMKLGREKTVDGIFQQGNVSIPEKDQARRVEMGSEWSREV